MFSFANVVLIVNSKSLKKFEDENIDEFENINFVLNNNVNIFDCLRFINNDRVEKFDLEDIILVNKDSYFRKY